MDDTKLYRAAVDSINTLGIDLLQLSNIPEKNIVLSPYSIQSALIQAFAGAAGETMVEMARVLHYAQEWNDINPSFAALVNMLEDTHLKSVTEFERAKQDLQNFCQRIHGENFDFSEDINAVEPIVLAIANRIFLQTGLKVHDSFVNLLKSVHRVVFESLDFANDPDGAIQYINAWVEEETHKRICDLIPQGSILSPMVLVNAIFFKARWSQPFYELITVDRPFYLQTGEMIMVPTMGAALNVGFSKGENFTSLTLPYDLGDIHFVILIPDSIDGLAELTTRLNPELLEKCANLPRREVILYLPKFRIEPPSMQLSEQFQTLGMKTAFDIPKGSANFEGIVPRKRDYYLYISEIFHKTFLELNEKGTEAAAATAVVSFAGAGAEDERPDEIFIDRPFFFAIQHRMSGACLFLGYLTDPSKH